MATSTLIWYRLLPRGTEALKERVNLFYNSHSFPKGFGLWGREDKTLYWICSSEKNRKEILEQFSDYGVIETNNPPHINSNENLEFLVGDKHCLMFSD
jgi:hypothetical protein